MSQKFVQARELNSFECFELGRVAYEKSDWYHTIRWMSEALELIEKEKNNTNVDKFSVLDYLSFSTAKVILKINLSLISNIIFYLFQARKY